MIVWLLKTLEKNPASVFRKKDLIRKSESQFERLKHLGLLAFCQPNLHHETYPCTHPCSNACPMDVVNMDGKLFAICPEDSEVDPIPLAKDDIARYQCSLDVLIKAIREANDIDGDSYSFSSRMYFIGKHVIKGLSIAFILAFFPDAEAAEPHLLSLPTRIAANYQRVVVITPSLSLTEEPIYAKLRTASIFPVTLPSSFGQDNHKISYVAALRKPPLAETSGEPGSNVKGMTWQQAQEEAIKHIDNNGFPGIEKLSKEVGCSKGTMYKAIKNSRVLKQAKREYDARRNAARKTLKAVGLSSKTLVKQEQTTETAPEIQAEVNATDRKTMIEYMIKKLPPEKREKAKKAFEEKSEQEVRDIYKVFLETRDYDPRHKQA